MPRVNDSYAGKYTPETADVFYQRLRGAIHKQLNGSADSSSQASDSSQASANLRDPADVLAGSVADLNKKNGPTLGQLERVATGRLVALLAKIKPVPEEWLNGHVNGHSVHVALAQGNTKPCESYSHLLQSWHKALKWTDGLDHALTCMLASVLSTNMLGDQLWLKVIGPAACGKSTLCEALSIAKNYVLAKSTIRGFTSGFGDGSRDNSLIAEVGGKTLVTKDGDTLLQSPNLEQILAEARDFYDTTIRTHYRTGTSNRDYAGIRMTWILCGTSSLRQLDSSELGERFIDVVIMHGIDDELEDEILWRTVNRANRNISTASDGTFRTQQDPDLTEAMQLTGGYVNYLRENAEQILKEITFSDENLILCAKYAKFTAFMRARPSSRQMESAEREFSTRLASQFTRMAKCLAGVMNKSSVDKHVMERIRKIAMDTSRGTVLKIARYLHEQSGQPMGIQAIRLHSDQTETQCREMMRFLRLIGLVRLITPVTMASNGAMVRGKPGYVLAEVVEKLYSRVVENC